jgi:S1-C subfamily serine protease
VDWNEVGEAVDWWAPGDSWQPVEVRRLKNIEEKQVAVNHLSLFYKTDADVARGSLLFSNNGDFSGMINKDGSIILSRLVVIQIGSLLEKSRTTYPLFAWRGFWVNGVEQDGKLLPLKGLYISDIGSKIVNSGPKKGDVILKVDGQAVENFSLLEQLLTAPIEFNLTVWRNGQEVDLTIDK